VALDALAFGCQCFMHKKSVKASLGKITSNRAELLYDYEASTFKYHDAPTLYDLGRDYGENSI
jgi:hypothetical protein